MSKVTVYGREDPQKQCGKSDSTRIPRASEQLKAESAGIKPVRVLEYETNRHYLAINREVRRPIGAWERNAAQLPRRYSLHGRRELVGPTGIASLACQY